MDSVSDKMYYLQYSDPCAGDLFIATNNLPYYFLASALNSLFFNFYLNYQHCPLAIDCNTVSILKTSEGDFNIFDPHSRNSFSMPHPFGKCVVISVKVQKNMQNKNGNRNFLPGSTYLAIVISSYYCNK